MSDLEYPDTAEEVTVVTWHRGDTSIVISVPHGGTIGRCMIELETNIRED